MVFTTLVYCENGYTTDECNKVQFSLDNFTLNSTEGDSLKMCTVDFDDGTIITKENMPKLITYNGKLCFDLRTKLAQIGEDNSKISMENDKNLVVIPWKEYDTEKQEITTDYSITNTNNVFTNGSGYLTVNIPYDNVNIIIPEGANIFQNNVIFNVTGNNVNLIVRGTLDNNKNDYNYCNSLFYFHQNANILIGATATINYNNKGHDPLFFFRMEDW